MSSNRRKQGSADGQDTHVWSSLQSRLSALQDVQAKVTESTELVNGLQKQYDDFEDSLTQQMDEDRIDDDQDDERRDLRTRLLEALDGLQDQSEQEKIMAAEALESLSILMALRAPEQLQVPVDTSKRKKRKLEASPAPSDVSSARASPAPPGGPPTPSLEKTSRGLSRSLSVNTSGQGASVPSEATPATGTPSTARSVSKQQQQQQQQIMPTRKERKEAFMAQLPLKEGRQVAFRPPVKGTGKGAKIDPGAQDWFLTTVVRCISGDKNRYEVQDVQDEQGQDGKPGASYNTTLKSIMVLPDPRDRSTYPNPPYPVGTEVIAMYPDTTSFYKARVVASPGKRPPQVYKVVFEDDNEEVKTVSIDHVVEAPEK